MLYEFLTRERNTILSDAKQRAEQSRWARVTPDIVERGWSIFYDDLMTFLRPEEIQQQGSSADGVSDSHAAPQQGGDSPVSRSASFLKLGFAISEVVQSYGLIYQAITESAAKLQVEITPEEFQKLNQSLDTSISALVNEFEKAETNNGYSAETERLGSLAHELRNSLQSAFIAIEMIETASLSMQSKTGQLLQSSLGRMAELIDNALAQVRMQVEPTVRLRKVMLSDVLNEIGVTAGFQARSRDLHLQIESTRGLSVLIDRHLFVSAVANLVQNALKFSRPGGTITIRTKLEGDRILIELEDECGGLADGNIEELFEAGVQKSADRTGLGLGLKISRQAIAQNNGVLRVSNLPGKGCIFTIDLPKPEIEET